MSRSQRGDTIIEVLLSFTVFSMLAVLAITIMNQGTATAQKSLETTLVRQQIDTQADLIRYTYDQLIAKQGGSAVSDTAYESWNKISKNQLNGGLGANQASSFEITSDGACPIIPSQSFVLDSRNDAAVVSVTDTSNANDNSSMTYSQLLHDNNVAIPQGLWVQSVPSADGYVDFHIRACWYAPGSGPATISGTIVRLYVPSE